MTSAAYSVTEAELYLQSVHTKTNNASPHEQMRELVGFANSIIAAKSSISHTMWAKAETVVNSLIQTSEHLQQEQNQLCYRVGPTKNDSDVSHTPGGIQQTNGNQCELNLAENAQQTSSGSTKVHHDDTVHNNTEEIGEIEWEGMVASDVKFEQVMGCAIAIDAIRESVIIPMQYPALFKRLNVKRSNGIMLYGPPGTGKSMIARATASEVNACFFNASCADLTSRWVGGSEKKLKSLFAAAVRNSPSIIFFDEVDSIACKREGDGSIADQRLTNQLLIELDKIFLAQQEVFVIAATNLPWQIDLAVMRRFPHTVYIELPDLHSRKCMFRSFFDIKVCSDENIEELATISHQMSGSDIANVVNHVLFEPIRALCKATHFVCTTSRHSNTSENEETSDTVTNCIAVATESDIGQYSTQVTHILNNVNTLLLHSSLSKVVLEYGEDSVTMPAVDYGCIRAQVAAFRHTVSREYLQQYILFHDQHR